MNQEDEDEYQYPGIGGTSAASSRGSGKASVKSKMPKAGKVPGLRGGGGGKISVKKGGGGKMKAAPKPAKFERAGESSRKIVAASQKPSPAAARYLPAGGGHKSGGPKKRGSRG